METNKEATQDQFLGLWRTAKDLGIDREMFEKMLPNVVASMKGQRDKILAYRQNCVTLDLSAFVNQGQPYIEALEDVAPRTPLNYGSRMVGDPYPPVSDKLEKVDFVLRNFPMGCGSWIKALQWAETKGYQKTNPREVFAVFKQHDLFNIIGRSRVYLVATEECLALKKHKTVGVFTDGTDIKIEVHLTTLDELGCAHDWFLFRK